MSGRVARDRDINNAQFAMTIAKMKKADPAIISNILAHCNDPSHFNFSTRLFVLLADSKRAGHEHIISWNEEGTVFKIHTRDGLVSLLPQYGFNQSRWDSFLRQLSHYKFKRITSGEMQGGYHLENFLRDRPDLVHTISCNRVHGGPKAKEAKQKASKDPKSTAKALPSKAKKPKQQPPKNHQSTPLAPQRPATIPIRKPAVKARNVIPEKETEDEKEIIRFNRDHLLARQAKKAWEARKTMEETFLQQRSQQEQAKKKASAQRTKKQARRQAREVVWTVSEEAIRLATREEARKKAIRDAQAKQEAQAKEVARAMEEAMAEAMKQIMKAKEEGTIKATVETPQKPVSAPPPAPEVTPEIHDEYLYI